MSVWRACVWLVLYRVAVLSLLYIFFLFFVYVSSFVLLLTFNTKKGIIEASEKTVLSSCNCFLVWIIKWKNEWTNDFALNTEYETLLKQTVQFFFIFLSIFLSLSLSLSHNFHLMVFFFVLVRSNFSFQLQPWELIICDLIVCVRACICGLVFVIRKNISIQTWWYRDMNNIYYCYCVLRRGEMWSVFCRVLTNFPFCSVLKRECVVLPFVVVICFVTAVVDNEIDIDIDIIVVAVIVLVVIKSVLLFTRIQECPDKRAVVCVRASVTNACIYGWIYNFDNINATQDDLWLHNKFQCYWCVCFVLWTNK